MIQALPISLQGPIRSWGGLSAGDNRDTQSYPTASAIIGFAAACMGINCNNQRLTRKWFAGFEVITLTTLMFSTRSPYGQINTTTPQLLTDFHTTKNSFGMDGKTKKDTIISHRGYITDCIDIAAIIPVHQKAKEWLQNLVYAFHQPAFTPYLGRRANVFSVPPLEQGEKTREYRTYMDIIEELYQRLALAKIGTLEPCCCLLRIPQQYTETDLLLQHNWTKRGPKQQPDKRSTGFQSYEQRLVMEFQKNMIKGREN